MIFCNLSRTHFIIQTSFLAFDNEYLINKSGIKRSIQNMYIKYRGICVMWFETNKNAIIWFKEYPLIMFKQIEVQW